MGAWIETVKDNDVIVNNLSHPTWVRGLKHRLSVRLSLPSTSHPTWVRGLKHACAHDFCIRIRVAPYVGAWIETVKR